MSFETTKHECRNAAEFLQTLDIGGALQLEKPRVNLNLNQWIFRGQASADWLLLPAALRATPKLPILYNPDVSEWSNFQRDRAEKQIQDEYATLRRFFQTADAAGIHLPGDSSKVRQHVLSLRHFSDGPETAIGTQDVWPPDELLGILALAQHNGLPTRLLDWSYKPFVAAYFAAYGALSDPPKDAERLCVWALDASTIQGSDLWGIDFSKQEYPPLEIAHPPRADNANLHAQSGVFTYQRVIVRKLRNDTPVARETVDAIMSRARAPWLDYSTLQKITLPISEAKDLLNRLYHLGVTAATVFPGTGGVVRALEEEQWLTGARKPRVPCGSGEIPQQKPS